jgi:hypothetical protein
MLSRSQLTDLQTGDLIEVGAILAGLTKEPVVLRTDTKTDNGKGSLSVAFVVTYFGINLGRWTATVKGEAVSWQGL